MHACSLLSSSQMSQAAYLSSPLSGEGGGMPEGGEGGGVPEGGYWEVGVSGGGMFQWKTNCSSFNVLACFSKWIY